MELSSGFGALVGWWVGGAVWVGFGLLGHGWLAVGLVWLRAGYWFRIGAGLVWGWFGNGLRPRDKFRFGVGFEVDLGLA